MNRPQDDWLPTRHTLIARLKNLEDEQSWREFFDLYGKLIYSVARKSGLAHDEAEDAVQEVVLCVARKIEQFKPGRELGSFKAWLGQLIRWRIIDLIRRRAKEIRTADMELPQAGSGRDSTTGVIARVPDPAGDAYQRQWDEEWANAFAETAMERLKKRLKPKHYQIFQLHVLRGQPADRVAEAFGVKVGQVYLIKNRIQAALRRERAAIEKAAAFTQRGRA
jgi:RNA polymerase sigma-70 factor (ECF subfamily)